jgi:hypothetical protein
VGSLAVLCIAVCNYSIYIECIPYGNAMDQISKKTPNPKCRVFLKIDHYRNLPAGVYLSAPDPLPCYTMYEYMYPCTYSHKEGGEVNQ